MDGVIFVNRLQDIIGYAKNLTTELAEISIVKRAFRDHRESHCIRLTGSESKSDNRRTYSLQPNSLQPNSLTKNAELRIIEGTSSIFEIQRSPYSILLTHSHHSLSLLPNLHFRNKLIQHHLQIRVIQFPAVRSLPVRRVC